MFSRIWFACVSLVLFALAAAAWGQNSEYRVIAVGDGGTITGTVKWSGPVPHAPTLPITKDREICDPESHKVRDLERLIIGPQGGVANTIVYLKNVSSGKAFDFPEARRFVDQHHCRYEPHILLVPQQSALQMKSSDATLHTLHMDGAASYNLPFPFPNQTVSRDMNTAGLVNVKCNGGHTWMNAEIMVAPHPYFAVTDETGQFRLTNVPPGKYELVAWHEGWEMTRQETAFDVLTERKVQRPVFSEPKTWQKEVTVSPNAAAVVNYTITER